MGRWDSEPCMCGCDLLAESRRQPYAAGHEGRSYRRILSWLENRGTLAYEEAIFSQINVIKFLTPSSKVFVAKHWLERLAEELEVWHKRTLMDPELVTAQIEEESAPGSGDVRRFTLRFTGPEWWLISIPGRPADANIDVALAGTGATDVWSLNNDTNEWEFARSEEEGHLEGTLSTLADGRSYFVRCLSPGTWSIPLGELDDERPCYEVAAGWNGIGFTPPAGRQSMRVDEYLSTLGADGWAMILMLKSDSTGIGDSLTYEICTNDGWSTPDFPTNDEGIPILQAGVGYLLCATRDGVICT